MNLYFKSGETLENAYKTENIATNHAYRTNNIYENFPPKMNDGRSVIAPWQSPDVIVNDMLLDKNEIKSNWQYRKYLMANSVHIQQKLFSDAMSDVGFYSVRNNDEYLKNQYLPPTLYHSFSDPVSHRNSESSDLKETYLSREQLHSNKNISSLTQAEIATLMKK